MTENELNGVIEKRRRVLARRRRLVKMAAGSLVALLVLAAGVFAYFLSHGTGAGNASVGVLNAPTSVVAKAANGSTSQGPSPVTITWSAPSSGVTPTSYHVKRGTTLLSCTSSPCTDNGVPDGTYTYHVMSLVGTSWTSSAQDSTSIQVQSNSVDGSGTMTVSPTTVSPSQTGRTFTFTYTAAAGGLSGGEVDVAVPVGWTAPTAANAAGCTTASTGSVAVTGTSPWTVKVTGITLAGGSTLIVSYGATSGSACTASDTVTATSTSGAATFTTQEKSTSGGTLTSVATQPSVTVLAANGSGTMTVSPTNVSASQSGRTFGFTYTAAAGGLSNGEVDVAVPSGWTAPVITNNPGCVSATTGTVAIATRTIQVTGVTIPAGATLTINYGATSGGACASGDTVTATATTGSATFTTQEKSTSGGR